MKRLLVLLAALAVVPAYAYINENETSDYRVLGQQGFSRSMVEVVDTVRYRSQGSENRYKRVFVKKGKNKLGRSYTYIKNYIDPIQDDGLFGEHSINYTNNWNGDDTHYSSGKTFVGKVDNL